MEHAMPAFSAAISAQKAIPSYNPSTLMGKSTAQKAWKRSLSRTLLRRKNTAVTWQSSQPHPEWQY